MSGTGRRSALFLLGLAFAAWPLAANPIEVDSTADDTKVDGECTLREAIIAANLDSTVDSCAAGGGGSDEITFVGKAAGGTIEIGLPNDPFRPLDDVIIKGPVTLSGAGHSNIIEVGGALYIRLEELTLEKGKESGSAGALLLPSNGLAEIVKCTFRDNSADSTGGAIDAGGTMLTIEGSHFAGNRAGMQGGAVSSGGIVTITDTTFEGNEANGGGAVNCTSGIITVTDGKFYDNKALGNPVNGGFSDGGGALKSGCETKLIHSVFENNRADGPFGGGAVLLTSAAEGTAVEDTIFDGNLANGGGAILCSFGILGIERSLFVANNASGAMMDDKFTRGGGAVMSSCLTTIEHSLFQTNMAFGRVGGGAILFTTFADGSLVRRSVFRENNAWLELLTADGGGGGAIHAKGDVVIDRSSIDRNFAHADWGGGGIVFHDSESAVVNTTIVDNLSTLDDKIKFTKHPVTGEIIILPPDKGWVGGAVAVAGGSVVQLIASSLALNMGTSELEVQFGTVSLVFLHSSLIEAGQIASTCSGELGNVIDADGHSLQWQGVGTPTCTLVPAPAAIGSLQKTDGDFGIGLPDLQPLKFDYTVPAANGPAAGGGDPATCANAPVNGTDLLDKQRIPDFCTVGAVEVSGR
jgi:CSLREA domain-containing protein